MTMELILWGIFISVASSALYRVMSSLWNSASSKVNDYRQVKYLSKLINKYISDISDANGDEYRDEEFKTISDKFQHDLKLFGLTRSRYLSVEKRGEFQLARNAEPDIYFTTKEGYLSRCEQYKKLKWINKRLK